MPGNTDRSELALSPIYYVRHPDASYSNADPQPMAAVPSQSAEQAAQHILDHSGLGESATPERRQLLIHYWERFVTDAITHATAELRSQLAQVTIERDQLKHVKQDAVSGGVEHGWSGRRSHYPLLLRFLRTMQTAARVSRRCRRCAGARLPPAKPQPVTNSVMLPLAASKPPALPHVLSGGRVVQIRYLRLKRSSSHSVARSKWAAPRQYLARGPSCEESCKIVRNSGKNTRYTAY